MYFQMFCCLKRMQWFVKAPVNIFVHKYKNLGKYTDMALTETKNLRRYLSMMLNTKTEAQSLTYAR